MASDPLTVPDGRGSDRPPGKADRVRAELLTQIAAGELAPGERLPAERKLAERLGVSRVSVRAALQTLKAQGFIDSVRGGGTRVMAGGGADPALAELARLDRMNMRDLMDLRCEIEVWAARRAAERAGPADFAALDAALAAMAEPGADKAAADVAFHMAIARASGSAVYRHLLSVIRNTLAEMLIYHRTRLFATPSDDATVMAHHRAIAAAISVGDPALAADAMRTHLRWARDHYAGELP
jgi:DNA-binding FadR family transcriptional regulator